MTDHEQDMSDAEGEEERPWEKPGQVRRDCEPHRSPLLLLIAKAALVCSLLSICLFIPAFIGFPLAIFAYTLAKRDLRCMENGTMDPAGARQAGRARDAAVAGAVVSGAVLLLAWFYMIIQASIAISDAVTPVRK